MQEIECEKLLVEIYFIVILEKLLVCKMQIKTHNMTEYEVYSNYSGVLVLQTHSTHGWHALKISFAIHGSLWPEF